MKPATYFRSEGRTLKLTNLDKVLFPAADFRKKDVLRYYQQVAGAVLPHLRDRPFTFRRFPDGVDEPAFYEKNCPSHRPAWVKTGRLGDVRHCLINDTPSLLWAANLAAIELHTTMGRVSAPGIADFVVFDLDPGTGCGIAECCEVALLLRRLLSDQGLECWPKTSGKKGLHVFMPVNPGVSFLVTREFARRTAVSLEASHPDRVVSAMSKKLRKGKVFIDWSQNVEFKTTTTVYSLRAEPYPWVSTPVSWTEVLRGSRSASAADSRLKFLPAQVLRRLDRRGDLFGPVLEYRQSLTFFSRATPAGPGHRARGFLSPEG